MMDDPIEKVVCEKCGSSDHIHMLGNFGMMSTGKTHYPKEIWCCDKCDMTFVFDPNNGKYVDLRKNINAE